MDYQKQIDSILEQALTEKTFSLEVVGKIKELRDGFSQAKEEIEKLNENIKEQKETISKLRDEITSLTLKKDEQEKALAEWKEREKYLEEREKNIALLEQRVQLQTARAEEIKELFGWTIKGPMVIRTKSAQVPVVVPGANGSQGYVNTYTQSETETEEVK